MTRRYSYDRMTPEQFSAALNQLHLTMRQFCRLSGKSEAKAERWLSGDEDIPHDVTVMLTMATVPDALERARAVTDAMVRERSDDHV